MFQDAKGMLDNNRLEGRLSAGTWPKNENASRPRSGPSENSPAIYRWVQYEIVTAREADG